MDPTPFDELLSLMLEGRLDEAGQRELAARLEADGPAAREALQLWLQEARIRHLVAGRPDAARCAANVLQTLRDQTPLPGSLSRKVLARLSQAGASAPGRTTRRLRSLAAQRARREGERRSVFWGVLGAAAACLAIAAAVALNYPRQQARRPPGTPDAAVTAAGAPPSRGETQPPPREDVARADGGVPEVPAPTTAGADKELAPQPPPEEHALQPEPRDEEPETWAARPSSPPAATPPPPAAHTAPPVPAHPETTVAPVSLVRAEGRVLLLANGRKSTARTGQGLVPGQGLQTVGRQSLAVATYADTTRLELGADTTVDRLLDADAPAPDVPPGGAGPLPARRSPTGAGGSRPDEASRPPGVTARKRVSLSRGVLTVRAAPQPVGLPMTFATPHAEVTVLGTTLALSVGVESTRLEVEEGKARLVRLQDGAAVEVPAGHYAVAGKGIEPAVKPLDVAPPAPGVLLLAEEFTDPRTAGLLWQPVKGGFPAALLDGRLDIDLTPRPIGEYRNNWRQAGGFFTKASFHLPLRVSADVEAPIPHDDLIAAVALRPAKGAKGEEVWAGLRADAAIAGFGASVEGAPVSAQWPRGARLAVEIDPADGVRVFLDGRQALHYKTSSRLPEAAHVGLTGNAHPDVPPGARVRFDNVRIEQMGVVKK